MSSLVIHAWKVYKQNEEWYLPYTHWIYLKDIIKYYDRICLLSPVSELPSESNHSYLTLSSLGNIDVLELPDSTGYVNAIKYFFRYIKAYKVLKSSYEDVYVRYPVPFGWLSKFYFKGKRIIHFVGDPIDATRNNLNISKYKRYLLIALFFPEHLIYIWACRGAKVFTNGEHLNIKLRRYGVSATTLISSTLNRDDFYLDLNKNSFDLKTGINMIYVGYLRKAKGVEVIIAAYEKILQEFSDATLTIVGAGEFELELKAMANNIPNSNIFFSGHIDNRSDLNSMLRGHDVFCFASLSEGSPRVILEAMANGINIVSTPVGSLPSIFVEDTEILYADFNNSSDFYERIKYLILNPEIAKDIRESIP